MAQPAAFESLADAAMSVFLAVSEKQGHPYKVDVRPMLDSCRMLAFDSRFREASGMQPAEADCFCPWQQKRIGTRLHAAANNGSVQSTQYWLQKGVPIDALNEEGYSALGLAVKSNNSVEVVRLLLAAGAEIGSGRACCTGAFDLAPRHPVALASNRLGPIRDATMKAGQQTYLKILELLVAHPGFLDACLPGQGQHYRPRVDVYTAAARVGNVAVLRSAWSRGVPFDYPLYSICAALQHGQHEAADFLLSITRGVEVVLRDSAVELLQSAAASGVLVIVAFVELLLGYRASSLKRKDLESVLRRAEACESLDIVSYLRKPPVAVSRADTRRQGQPKISRKTGTGR